MQPASATQSASTARETVALRAFSFALYSTMAIIVSFFPIFFQSRGYNASQIGILYALGPATAIFSNLLVGIISDKYRTIKKLLAALLLGQLLVILILLQVDGFVAVCIIMAWFYFFQTPVNPLNDSLILLSTSYTGRSYPSIRIFGSMGFAFSALAIGLFLNKSGPELTIVLCMITITISLALSFTLRDYQGSLKKADFSGLYKIMRQPNALIFFFLILILSISHRMYEGFFAITMNNLGASSSLIGTAWLISAVSETPILFLLGKYGHKIRELPLLAFASLVYGTRFWLMSILTEPVWALALQSMHSLSFGIYMVTALRYISNMIPDEYRATGQAVYAVVWTGFAGVISGMLGGMIYDWFGQEPFFRIAALLALAAGAGFLVQHLRTR